MKAGFAPAKVNLFLHVGPLAADGYHPLQSWMVFADVGDQLTLTDGDQTFEVTGPFARGVPTDASNLVLKARDAFLAEQPLPPFGLVLDKQLPPASGIGGGSSDAAAVLRLLQQRAPMPEGRLFALARTLGADVPACLQSSALMAAGRGEVISAAPMTPPLPAVLVNPGVAVSTAEVFKRFDLADASSIGTGWRSKDAKDVPAAIALAAAGTNDLQAIAQAIAPIIGEVIATLAIDERCKLARMSGSGATCFGLCETEADAQGLAKDIAKLHPAWWVRAAALS